MLIASDWLNLFAADALLLSVWSQIQLLYPKDDKKKIKKN